MVWLAYQDTAFDSEWVRHEISGPTGSKFDRVGLLDLDADGDLDAVTTEENFGEESTGLGAIWCENPRTNSKRGAQVPLARVESGPPCLAAPNFKLDDVLTGRSIVLEYESSFDAPLRMVAWSDLTQDGHYVREPDGAVDWILEGAGSVKVEDGALHMASPKCTRCCGTGVGFPRILSPNGVFGAIIRRDWSSCSLQRSIDGRIHLPAGPPGPRACVSGLHQK